MFVTGDEQGDRLVPWQPWDGHMGRLACVTTTPALPPGSCSRVDARSG